MKYPPIKQDIFLIGGTGFIGKVVLERLLATTDSRVWMLVRSKKGMKPDERFAAFRRIQCFAKVQEAFDQDRVKMIAGDICEPGLGLSKADTVFLTENITHIISLAACIDFDRPMGEAVLSNTTSALRILDVAKACKRLHRYVHCSTALHSGPHKE